jgi:hypothetical protein
MKSHKCVMRRLIGEMTPSRMGASNNGLNKDSGFC